jgi:hypothetical protein
VTALLFVAGVCGRSACGRAFVLASPSGVPTAGASYCSDTCRKAMIRKRYRARQRTVRPSCAGCAEPTPVRVPICSDCKGALGAMCGGKRRTGREQAEHSALTWQMNAYMCEVCGEWHAGKRGAWTEIHARNIRAIVDRLRAAGAGWVLRELAYEWHPNRTDRAEVREVATA